MSVAASPASAQVDYEARQRTRQLPIARAAAAITLDGALDEAAWQTAAVASDFLQNEPNDGEPASERTDVRVTYDGGFLYIGVVAHDSAPHEIIVSDLKKDFDPSTSDAFEVISGRRCRASTRSPACRAPGPSKGCAASGPATICG